MPRLIIIFSTPLFFKTFAFCAWLKSGHISEYNAKGRRRWPFDDVFILLEPMYMQIFQPILRKLCHIPEISTSFCKSPSLIVYWTDKINFEQKKCFEKEKRRIFVDKVQFHFWKKIDSIKSTNSESDVNIFFWFYCLLL